MKRIIKILSVVLVFVFLFGSVSAFAINEDKPLYVVLGDSIAKGNGLDNRTVACYGAIVANSNDYEYRNYGVGGHETSDLLARLKEEEVRTSVIDADIISISIGGNDFTNSGMLKHVFNALFRNDYSSFDDANESFYKNFSLLMQEIKSLNPDALILIQTLYNPRFDLLQKTYQEAADRLNASIFSYLDENPGSYVIVDVATLFAGDKSMIAKDELHPGAKGHVKIAEAILQTLYDLGYASATEATIIEEGVDDEGDFFEKLLRSMLNAFLKVMAIFF